MINVLHQRVGPLRTSVTVSTPSQKQTSFLGLARDYPTSGFPEFDRLTYVSYPTYRPMQERLPYHSQRRWLLSVSASFELICDEVKADGKGFAS